MAVSSPSDKLVIDPKSIQGLKSFSALSSLLERRRDVGTARDKAGNRDWFCDRDVSPMWWYFFNPTLTSLRGIPAASQLPKVRKTLGCRPTSLGSFSETSHVFDAESLPPILAELAARLRPLAAAGRSREAELLAGQGCEKKSLRRMLDAGRFDTPRGHE